MVIIIGAGISGLYLGKLLQEKGIAFKILEARDRIGGRVSTLNLSNDFPIEMGPTWFGNQHLNLKKLIDEL